MDNLLATKEEKEVLGGSKISPSITKEEVYTHFGERVRIGTRKIKVVEVPKFSLLPKGPEAKEIRDEVVKKIGSQWRPNSRDIIRGLSSDEELYYLPKILGVSPRSDEWNDKVLNFWADFVIQVPSGEKGVELEVGFKKSIKPDSVRGNAEPINLEGYMRYKFCQENSQVATTEEQLENPYHMNFYIVDVEKDLIDKEQRFNAMKSINRLFTKLISSQDQQDRNKIDWILETAGGEEGVGINIMNLSITQREMELEKFKDKNPDEFQKLINDPNLEMKALLRKAVEKSIIDQEGNAYFLDAKQIGGTLMEAVGYLSNPANQQDKFRVIARLKESVK